MASIQIGEARQILKYWVLDAVSSMIGRPHATPQQKSRNLNWGIDI